MRDLKNCFWFRNFIDQLMEFQQKCLYGYDLKKGLDLPLGEKK